MCRGPRSVLSVLESMSKDRRKRFGPEHLAVLATEAEERIVSFLNEAEVLEDAVCVPAGLQINRVNEHVVSVRFGHPASGFRHGRRENGVRFHLDTPDALHLVIDAAPVVAVQRVDDLREVLDIEPDGFVGAGLAREHGELERQGNHARLGVEVRRETDDSVPGAGTKVAAQVDPVSAEHQAVAGLVAGAETDDAGAAGDNDERIEDLRIDFVLDPFEAVLADRRGLQVKFLPSSQYLQNGHTHDG